MIQSRWVYLASFILPVVVLTGNTTGGPITLSGLVLVYGLYPLLDIAFGKSEGRNLEHEDPFFFDTILFAHAVLQTLTVITLLRLVWLDGLTLWTGAAIVATGTCSGVSSIVIAHELIHRKSRWQRWIGIYLLGTVLDMHFYVEHIRGHHKFVATDRDPASARREESVWTFIWRTIPQQWHSAYRLMRDKQGAGWRNLVVRFAIVQIGSLALLAGFSPLLAAAWLWQSVIAQTLLEYVNYIRHWGLRRGDNEPVLAAHSWQSNQRWSRWTLVELTRHADHHMTASKAYWKLQVYDDGPQLPSGYYGIFYPCLIPPWWRKMMATHLPSSDL